MQHRGYTLIELLAVVAVLGLAAGVGIPPLVRLVGGSPLDRACHAVHMGDLRARHLASGSGLELDLAEDGLSSRSATTEHRVMVDAGTTLSWQTSEGNPLRRLMIDPRGRSIDVQVQVTVGADRRRFLVAGISGEWSEVLPSKPTLPPVAP